MKLGRQRAMEVARIRDKTRPRPNIPGGGLEGGISHAVLFSEIAWLTETHVIDFIAKIYFAHARCYRWMYRPPSGNGEETVMSTCR